MPALAPGEVLSGVASSDLLVRTTVRGSVGNRHLPLVLLRTNSGHKSLIIATF